MEDRNLATPRSLSRRTLLKQGAGIGLGALALGALPAILQACGGSATSSSVTGPITLSVLSNQPPDPAPPGPAQFAMEQFKAWQTANNASVNYEAIPYTQMHDKLATAFASGNPPWDVAYMSGWVPEFSKNLADLGPMLSPELKNDLPPSSFKTVTWDGKVQGVVFTLSLMTLFYNTAMFEAKGIKTPPKTWDELLGYTKELTGDGKWGWVNNYGTPEGIGGTANIFMAYLQQAGGTMWDASGMPVFGNDAGVQATQYLVDLWDAGTEPGSISYVGIADTTNVFTAGKAAMMMNWPFMWKPASDPASSSIAGSLASAVLPAGPAGTASIDGTDAWTVVKASKNPESAAKLIEFYLSPDVQKQQLLQTGWLPIRMSSLQDAEVQKAAPNAGVVLEQAKSPYDSFVTPDYIEVTAAMGVEIQKAIRKEKTAAQAMKDATDQVTAIVKARS
jgi:multiple sugar transport system substrate-binding protein